MSLWHCVWLHFAMSCATCLRAACVGVSSCHFLYTMVVVSTNWCTYQQLLQSNGRHCEVADCMGSDGALRNNVVQLGGVPICRTAAPRWTRWSAVLAIEFHIPWFQALLWLHVDYIQKRILRVYNQIYRRNMRNKKFKRFRILRTSLLIAEKHDSSS
jgi:uncharacterized protein (DUF2236 family)